VPPNEYTSVKQSAENEINIERSRFIAYCFAATGEEEAKAAIAKIRKQNYSATHNCYAFICGENGGARFSDDGEPGGTAGAPILEVLKNRNLRNTAVVVTRYFGGIKLGAGGLVRAYSRAASEVLDKAGTVLYELSRIYELKLSYENFPKFNKFLSDKKAIVSNTDYGETVTVNIAVPESGADKFEKEASDFFAGKQNMRFIADEYMIYGDKK